MVVTVTVYVALLYSRPIVEFVVVAYAAATKATTVSGVTAGQADGKLASGSPAF